MQLTLWPLDVSRKTHFYLFVWLSYSNMKIRRFHGTATLFPKTGDTYSPAYEKTLKYPVRIKKGLIILSIICIRHIRKHIRVQSDQNALNKHKNTIRSLYMKKILFWLSDWIIGWWFISIHFQMLLKATHHLKIWKQIFFIVSFCEMGSAAFCVSRWRQWPDWWQRPKASPPPSISLSLPLCFPEGPVSSIQFK